MSDSFVFDVSNRFRLSIKSLYIFVGMHKQVLCICLKSLLELNRLSFVVDIVEVDRHYPRKENKVQFCHGFAECNVRTVQSQNEAMRCMSRACLPCPVLVLHNTGNFSKIKIPNRREQTLNDKQSPYEAADDNVTA